MCDNQGVLGALAAQMKKRNEPKPDDRQAEDVVDPRKKTAGGKRKRVANALSSQGNGSETLG